jgi:hypothetical protein
MYGKGGKAVISEFRWFKLSIQGATFCFWIEAPGTEDPGVLPGETKWLGRMVMEGQNKREESPLGKEAYRNKRNRSALQVNMCS